MNKRKNDVGILIGSVAGGWAVKIEPHRTSSVLVVVKAKEQAHLNAFFRTAVMGSGRAWESGGRFYAEVFVVDLPSGLLNCAKRTVGGALHTVTNPGGVQ